MRHAALHRQLSVLYLHLLRTSEQVNGPLLLLLQAQLSRMHRRAIYSSNIATSILSYTMRKNMR